MRQVLFTAVLLVLGCSVSRPGVCAAVPGYLDFDNLPDTNFSCEGKVIGGYYADVETGCQMFHVCTIGQKGEITDIKFLCLNGTVFDQETRVCERVDEVDCSKTEGFYGLNLELYGNTGATYGQEESEEAEDHEESQSHHSPTQSSSPPTPTSPSPPTSTSPPTTPTTVISTTPPPPPSTTAAHPFTPPTTISTISSTLHSYNQKPHTVHFSSTSSPHSVSSSFLSFPSGGDQLFDSDPEGSGGHSSDIDHFPPPSSSSSSWPKVNLQSGGGTGIIHQTDSSPFHALKTTPKPVNLFGAGGNSNGHSNHQFIFSTTKAPSHFFSPKGPGGFSVTSHPPVTQFPLKSPGHLIQTNIPPDFYHDQQNRNRPTQKNPASFLGHQSNVQIVPNPIHFQYSSRPTHQHPVFTTPSVQSTIVSSTSSVSSVKTTIKHQDDQQNTQNPPANVNSFAFGINSALSPTTFIEEKSVHNDTKQTPTPPTSYDEYHERDVALDPFFKDVPRISLKQGRSKRRRRRQTQENVQPSRGSRRFRNQSNSQSENQQQFSENQNLNPRRQSHRSSTTRQRISYTTPRLNSDSSQEPSSHIPTTEISRRLSSRRKTSLTPQTSPETLTRNSAIHESQVLQTGLNNHRNSESQQITNSKFNAPVQQSTIETTSELPSTTREPLPETSFTCDGKVVGGYYADPEADCRLFHICVLGRHGKIRDDKFLCGPGTRFDQMSRTCQTKHLVNCNLATSLYHVNLPYQFPQDNEPVPDIMFESHKVSKREARKEAERPEQEEDSLPDTDFSCENKPQEGLYADTKTNCKFFHLCQKNKNGLHLVSTFACPPGTAFNQREGNCDASEEIYCDIYSQPEHSFSKSRNRRSVLEELLTTGNIYKLPQLIKRSKRDSNKDSTETDFTCEDKQEEGLYADVETNCKYFHLCQKNKNGHLFLVSTFECPPGTSFNQREANCDVSKEIDCAIYSQPEHSFKKSKSRNRRNVLQEHEKREIKYILPQRIKRKTNEGSRETDFTCEDKIEEGLYADTQTNCKFFHLCQKNKKGSLYLVSTFECPLGTSFSQQEGNCDVSKEIDCAIYSQPAHSFAKSRSRNRRNVLQELQGIKSKNKLLQPTHRIKRNTDEVSRKTDFTCEDKTEEGLYADTQTNCKSFHLCQKNKKGSLYLVSTFECPLGTSFNQQEGNCDVSKEIDCAIYSQPAHSFTKSRSRNRRNVLEESLNQQNQFPISQFLIRHKRNIDTESTEVYYTDDEIQSSEREDQLDDSYENSSNDKLHDSSEDIGTESSDAFSDDDDNVKGDISQTKGRSYGKMKSSIMHSAASIDETSNETRETEITDEDEELESQSNEYSNNDSSEKEQYSNESKETPTSEDINNSQENYEKKDEKNESKNNEKSNKKSASHRKNSETSVENEEDNVSIEDETTEEDEKDKMLRKVHEEESLDRDNSFTKSEEKTDDGNKKESISAEESIEKASLNGQIKAETTKINNSKDNKKNTFEIEEIYEINTQNKTDDASLESSVDSSERRPFEVSKQNIKSKEQHRENSSSPDDTKKEKELEESQEDENENSNEKEEDEEKEETSFKKTDTFKSKVNQLLMKLNASVEDIHSINVNTTSDDYYDYYTDEESLLELEELKEKILSVDHSGKNKNKEISGESNTSKIEELREEVLEKEEPVPTKHNRKNSVNLSKNDKLQNSVRSETSQNRQKTDSTAGSIISTDESESSSPEEKGDSTKTDMPERWKISTEDELTTTTIHDDEKKKKKMGKPLQNISPAIPTNTDISEESLSTAVDHYEISTEYQYKTTEIITPDEEDAITIVPTVSINFEQLESEMTEQENETITSRLKEINDANSHTHPPKPESTLTDSDEDTETTTETFMTTFPPDTTTTTVPSTTSNLLHPYKSRPVYRTWRTTTPPPPVVIRPNSSLRLPRPRIRQGTNKGTITTESNTVNIREREREIPHKENINYVAKQDKSKDENIIKNKYTPRESINEKSVVTPHKSTTDSLSSTQTSVTDEDISLHDEALSVTSPLYITSTENYPMTESPENLERKKYDDSKTENSDKTLTYSLEDFRTADYDRMTPSSVLPTFSRKQFFIEREDQKITQPSITTETEFLTQSISTTEVPTDQSYFFTSVEAQTPQSFEDDNEGGKSETFTCSGKELHQYLPDPLDCHLFHYCSPGFHSRQLLDFRFMCDKGTAFSPITHHCENENESLCRNLHN